MITLVTPLNARGQGRDLLCPVVLCDLCDEPLDKEHPGDVLYDHCDQYVQQHVHRACCPTLPPGWSWRGMDEFLAQLVRNYDDPLVGATLDDGFTVVALETGVPNGHRN